MRLNVLLTRHQLNDTYCRPCFIICPTKRSLPCCFVEGVGLGTYVCITLSLFIATADLTWGGPLTHEESMNWVVSTIFLNTLRSGVQITVISCCCTLEPKRIVELELGIQCHKPEFERRKSHSTCRGADGPQRGPLSTWIVRRCGARLFSPPKGDAAIFSKFLFL